MSSTWRIELLPSAEKDLRAIPQPFRLRINTAIHGLAQNPRPLGSRLLELPRRLLRIRVGVYRVIYALEIEQRIVVVLRAGHRSSVYRNL